MGLEVKEVFRGHHVETDCAAHAEIPDILLPDEAKQDIPRADHDLFFFPRRDNAMARQAAGLLFPRKARVPLRVDIGHLFPSFADDISIIRKARGEEKRTKKEIRLFPANSVYWFRTERTGYTGGKP